MPSFNLHFQTDFEGTVLSGSREALIERALDIGPHLALGLDQKGEGEEIILFETCVVADDTVWLGSCAHDGNGYLGAQPGKGNAVDISYLYTSNASCCMIREGIFKKSFRSLATWFPQRPAYPRWDWLSEEFTINNVEPSLGFVSKSDVVFVDLADGIRFSSHLKMFMYDRGVSGSYQFRLYPFYIPFHLFMRIDGSIVNSIDIGRDDRELVFLHVYPRVFSTGLVRLLVGHHVVANGDWRTASWMDVLFGKQNPIHITELERPVRFGRPVR